MSGSHWCARRRRGPSPSAYRVIEDSFPRDPFETPCILTRAVPACPGIPIRGRHGVSGNTERGRAVSVYPRKMLRGRARIGFDLQNDGRTLSTHRKALPHRRIELCALPGGSNRRVRVQLRSRPPPLVPPGLFYPRKPGSRRATRNPASPCPAGNRQNTGERWRQASEAWQRSRREKRVRPALPPLNLQTEIVPGSAGSISGNLTRSWQRGRCMSCGSICPRRRGWKLWTWHSNGRSKKWKAGECRA